MGPEDRVVRDVIDSLKESILQCTCCLGTLCPSPRPPTREKAQYDGGVIGKGGTGTLSVDGQQVAQGRIEHTAGVRYTLNVESFDIGEDTGTAVDTSYEVPFYIHRHDQ